MSRSLRSDLSDAVARVRRAVAGAPGWLGGAAAGLQSAVLCVLLVMTPAIAAIGAAPTADGSTSVDWSGAAIVAVQVLLLAHAVPLQADAVAVTLVPLGLTLVCALIIMSVSRRFASKAWGSWLTAVLTYAGCITALTAIVWGSSATTAVLVRAAVVATLIAAPSVAMGIWRAHGAQLAWLSRMPAQLRTGLRLGGGTVALIVMAAAGASVIAAGLGSDAIASTATALNVDPVGGLVLAISETMYAPVMVAWMIAWLTGVGFSVGEGNLFAPSVVATDTLPTVPLLGALPQAQGGILVWAPLVIVAVAAIAWWHMRHRVEVGWRGVAVALTALVVVVLGCAGLTWAAAGAIGPGRLQTVGGEPWAVGIVAAALAAAGFVAAVGLQLLVFGARRQWTAMTGPSSPQAVLADASRELKVRRSPASAASASTRGP